MHRLFFLLVCFFEIAILFVFAMAAIGITCGFLPTCMEPLRIILLCVVMGGIGGAVYCIRGIYLHKCVQKNWDEDWYPWYYLRPVASAVCGGVSYLFLKAGLFILESTTKPEASELGFYVLAFMAGLNVDKFIEKIEGIAKTVWGIEKSRASRDFPPDEGR